MSRGIEQRFKKKKKKKKKNFISFPKFKPKKMGRTKLPLLLAVALGPLSAALPNNMGLLPEMGFNSWLVRADSGCIQLSNARRNDFHKRQTDSTKERLFARARAWRRLEVDLEDWGAIHGLTYRPLCDVKDMVHL